MRQVLIGSPTVSATGSDGFIGLYYIKNGVKTAITASNASEVKYGDIVVERSAAKGGDIVVPFAKHMFKYVKASPVTGSAFIASFDLSGVTITPGDDYTVIFAKKGVPFNKRNKWTFTYRAGASDTADKIAAAIAAYVTNNVDLGATATVSTSTVTFTAKDKRSDYKLLFADGLSGVSATVTARVLPQNDLEDMKVILSKAAADAGFEYTAKDDVSLLYPGMVDNPFASQSFTDYGFVVYTISFVEHREVATRDTGIKQIVQIVLPKKSASAEAAQAATLEAILTALAA